MSIGQHRTILINRLRLSDVAFDMLRPLSRATRTIMSSATTAPRVPIPKNGVDYKGKIVLAPMVRSGELPSRLMALKYGADLVWGPETIDRSLIGSTTRTNPRNSTVEYTRISSNGGRPDAPKKENTIYRIYPSLESPRLIFQLGTANPELAVEAARLVAPYVAGIDVNAGCPKPFSTSGGMGAALLSTPDLLCDILRSLVEKVGREFEIGISVKIRLLKTEEQTRALVQRLCGTGITGLTLHCRTREMRKTEKAVREQLRMVGEVCREAGVACLMNGDVEDRAQAEALVREFGVDGAMIATAAEKNPSVFRSAEDGGTAPWREVVGAYMDRAIEVENRWGNTKFLLAQMMPGKEQTRMGLSQAKNYEDVCERLELPLLVQRARELDSLLGITERVNKAEMKALKRAAEGKGAAQVSKKQKKQEMKQEMSHKEEEKQVEEGEKKVDLLEASTLPSPPSSDSEEKNVQRETPTHVSVPVAATTNPLDPASAPSISV